MKMRKFGVALLLAGAMATGILGGAKLEAKGKPGGGGGGGDICSTLQAQYASLDPSSTLAQLIALAISALGC